MLSCLTLIFCCQLAGEVTTRTTGIPIPGPVVGMVLLFCFLLVRGGIPENLAKTADGLLSNLSLLFVPAGVGVMLHANLLGKDWLAIGLALILSTALTIIVTALLMAWLRPMAGERTSPSTTDGGH